MTQDLEKTVEDLSTASARNILGLAEKEFGWWFDGGGTKEDLENFLGFAATGTIYFFSERLGMVSKTHGQIFLLMLRDIEKTLRSDSEG